MQDRLITQIREKVLRRQYIVTLHADEEMDDDELSILDVEHILLTGQIIEKQRDQRTGEPKYVIRGNAILGERACVVCKLSIARKLVIITAYKE